MAEFDDNNKQSTDSNHDINNSVSNNEANIKDPNIYDTNSSAANDSVANNNAANNGAAYNSVVNNSAANNSTATNSDTDINNENRNTVGRNDENNSVRNNNPAQNNKVPDYTFMAEQVPYGSSVSQDYSYQNQSNPNTGYPNYNYQNSVNPNSNDPNSNHPNYSYLNNGYRNNSANQNNGYQNNGYQNNNSYQNNSGYQNSSYQNNGYQNSSYQNNSYQNNSGTQNNPYTGYSYQNNPYPNSAYQNYSRPEKTKKDRKPVNKVVKFLAKAACFGLIAAAGFFGFTEIYYAINPDARINIISEEAGSDNSSYEIGFTEQGTIKFVDKTVISQVTSKTLPAIVSINMVSTQPAQWFGQSFDQQVEGSGSGIIVGEDEKELLIATNNHVVEGASQITVTFADGTQANAIVKGTDSTADLAVVTVDITTLTDATIDAISVAKLGNSDDVRVGEMVVAIGNALGYGQSVTVGYVSAKDREVDVSDGYTSNKMILLQTDAAINPGNSGGALINIDGEVIGINTVKYASAEVEGMGYAIPISKATPIINELMTREVLSEAQKGYLGISGTDVTEDVASFYNMPIGVFVKEVSQGGAAEKAGLQAEDIITGADDLEITSISQLKEYVNSLRVGTEVKITYMRNTNGQFEEATITVTLGQNPTLNQPN